MNFGDKITIQPSRQLTIWCVLQSIFALFCTLYALPFQWGLFVIPLIASYGFYELRNSAWRNSKKAIVALSHKTHQHWYLLDGQAKKWLVNYQGVAFRSPHFLLATFERLSDKRNFTVIIPKDATSKQNYTYLNFKLWF